MARSPRRRTHPAGRARWTGLGVVSHPDLLLVAALLGLLAAALLALLLQLLLLQLEVLEGAQQLLLAQPVRVVARGEALQQLQHLDDLGHQRRHVLAAAAVDDALHLGADGLGYLVHVVHCHGREGALEAALAVRGLGLALFVAGLHVFALSRRVASSGLLKAP